MGKSNSNNGSEQQRERGKTKRGGEKNQNDKNKIHDDRACAPARQHNGKTIVTLYTSKNNVKQSTVGCCSVDWLFGRLVDRLIAALVQDSPVLVEHRVRIVLPIGAVEGTSRARHGQRLPRLHPEVVQGALHPPYL